MSEHIKLKDAIERTNQLFHGDEVEAWLKSLPPIDIVHCKECKYYSDCYRVVEFNKGEDYLKHIDYCSYGARKEQEHD